MTVTATISRWAYIGDGATKVFPYTNRIFTKDDLLVSLDGVQQTVDTDYTVTGINDAGGGSVTFVTAPATGVSVSIVRSVAATQDVRLPLGGVFPSVTVETALDKLTILIQQIESRENRGLRLQDIDPAASINALPLKSELAGGFLGFDLDGEPLAAAGTSADLGPVSAYINTLLDDADAPTARNTLGLSSFATANELDVALISQVFC